MDLTAQAVDSSLVVKLTLLVTNIRTIYLVAEWAFSHTELAELVQDTYIEWGKLTSPITNELDLWTLSNPDSQVLQGSCKISPGQ